MIDEPVGLRAEDALPLSQLSGWLAERGFPGLPQVSQFPGGASNLTFLLTYPDRELVLRTPPRGRKAASSHDMGREALVMSALSGRFPVPTVLAQCTDEQVIGQPFYVMERVRGTILRSDLPAGATLAPPDAAALAERMIGLLAQLHALDAGALGLAGLDKGPGYVARQVSGWSARYRAARLPDSPDGEAVMAWLDTNQPADAARCLIHNDWRFDNLILDPADLRRVLAVLDWEMATIGDPLMDLGAAVAYWVQADDPEPFRSLRRQPSHLPGMPTRAAVVEQYLAASGLRLPAPGFTFYEVYGLFRLAGIAQQIYYRYAAGQTGNPALAGFGAAVDALIARCGELIS